MTTGVRSARAISVRKSESTLVAAIGSPNSNGGSVRKIEPSAGPVAARRYNLTRWSNPLCLLLADVLAFASAVATGGLVAYVINDCLLGTQYAAFEEPGLIPHLVVVACVAVGLCAWFARAGHYTERRLFRTDLAEILNACVIGLLINGFIEFAGRTSFSRLWMVFAWIFVAISIPLGRIVCRFILNAFGQWMLNAVIVGKGPHFNTVREFAFKG